MDNATTSSFITLPLAVYNQADGQCNAAIVYWALDRLKCEQLFNAKNCDSIRNDDFKEALALVDRVQGIQDSMVELLFEHLAERV